MLRTFLEFREFNCIKTRTQSVQLFITRHIWRIIMQFYHLFVTFDGYKVEGPQGKRIKPCDPQTTNETKPFLAMSVMHKSSYLSRSQIKPWNGSANSRRLSPTLFVFHVIFLSQWESHCPTWRILAHIVLSSGHRWSD